MTDELDITPDLPPDDAGAYAEGLAVRAAAERRDAGWVQYAARVALTAHHGFLRGEARIALQIAPADEAVAALLPSLLSPQRRVRRRAMNLLPRLDPHEVCRQLAPVLAGGDQRSRRAACVTLGAVGSAAQPLLQRLVEDADPAVRHRAGRALDAIAGRGPDVGDPGLSNVRPFGLPPPQSTPPVRPRSFAIAAFNFSYGVNLGTLIRSADAAGAEALWIVGRDFYNRPSTKGADWWLPIEVLPTARACLERARAEGYSVVALQQGPDAQLMWEADWPERPLIVAGNEGDGLPASFVEEADLQVELPVYGRIDSLNVAVATAVAMYSWRAWHAQRATKHG